MKWIVVAAALSAGCMANDPFIASAQSRVQGGCYSHCSVGWTCNSKTGLCEEIKAQPQGGGAFDVDGGARPPAAQD